MEESELSCSRAEVFENYALQIFSGAAEEILSAEDEEKFERLRQLLSGPDYALACALREAPDDPQVPDAGEIGSGTPLICEFWLQPADPELNAAWHVATVFFTEEGMEEKLGTVFWFPEEQQSSGCGSTEAP